MTGHVTDLCYSVSSFFRGQADTCGTQGLALNHTVSINYLAWPKTLLRGRIFQGLRGDLAGTKGHSTFYWHCLLKEVKPTQKKCQEGDCIVEKSAFDCYILNLLDKKT